MLTDLIQKTPSVELLVNNFAENTFRFNAKRVTSRMGILLEFAWGMFTDQVLKQDNSIFQINWNTVDEYNDFVCVDRRVQSFEIGRIEAKSMNTDADEGKSHFDQLSNFLTQSDLLVLMLWSFRAKDSVYYPFVHTTRIYPAQEIADFRDALHLARGGSFVDRYSCPDGCIPESCTHNGEPLNSSGKRERITGPKSCKPNGVSCAANFGGMIRMTKTRGIQAKQTLQYWESKSPVIAEYMRVIRTCVHPVIG